MLLNMLPQNPIASAAQSDLLPLIIAVCIFGAAATVTTGEGRRTVVAFFEGLNDLCMVIIGWLMRLAPAAVLILIASVSARSCAALLQGLLVYVLAVVAALAIHFAHLLVILPAAPRVDIWGFFASMSDALLLSPSRPRPRASRSRSAWPTRARVSASRLTWSASSSLPGRL